MSDYIFDSKEYFNTYVWYGLTNYLNNIILKYIIQKQSSIKFFPKWLSLSEIIWLVK